MVVYGRLKFEGVHGSNWDREKAKVCGFIPGETYITETICVEDYKTRVSVRGIGGTHNSVMFEGIPGSEV